MVMGLVLPEIPAAKAAGGPEQPSQNRLALGNHALAQAPVSLGTGYPAFGAIVLVVLLAAAVSTVERGRGQYSSGGSSQGLALGIR